MHWTLKKVTYKRLKTAETKFMRRKTRYSLSDHRRNEDISEEFKLHPVAKKYEQNS